MGLVTVLCFQDRAPVSLHVATCTVLWLAKTAGVGIEPSMQLHNTPGCGSPDAKSRRGGALRSLPRLLHGGPKVYSASLRWRVVEDACGLHGPCGHKSNPLLSQAEGLNPSSAMRKVPPHPPLGAGREPWPVGGQGSRGAAAAGCPLEGRAKEGRRAASLRSRQ